jgi:hypothetical protein
MSSQTKTAMCAAGAALVVGAAITVGHANHDTTEPEVATAQERMCWNLNEARLSISALTEAPVPTTPQARATWLTVVDAAANTYTAAADLPGIPESVEYGLAATNSTLVKAATAINDPEATDKIIPLLRAGSPADQGVIRWCRSTQPPA